MTTRQLIQQLPLHYKEYFESKFATTLLRHAELFPAAHTVSDLIQQFLLENRAQVIMQIQIKYQNIVDELYGERFFGRLFKKSMNLSAEAIYSDLMTVLQNRHAKLQQIMQVHAIFIYRIFKPLADKTLQKQIKEAEEKYSCETVYSDKDRGRMKKPISVSTCQLGVTRDPVFKTLIDEDELHEAGLDGHELKSSTEFCYEVQTENIPSVAGTSSHTQSFMLLATLFAQLNGEALQEYILACFAFLASGGNHTFHEVMVVARLPYETNHYIACIPTSIRTKAVFQQLQQEFPEFLTLPADAKQEDKTSLFKNILPKIHFIKTAHKMLAELFLGDAKIAGKILQFCA